MHGDAHVEQRFRTSISSPHTDILPERDLSSIARDWFCFFQQQQYLRLSGAGRRLLGIVHLLLSHACSSSPLSDLGLPTRRKWAEALIHGDTNALIYRTWHTANYSDANYPWRSTKVSSGLSGQPRLTWSVASTGESVAYVFGPISMCTSVFTSINVAGYCLVA